jgi:C4-dicarboxylate-specific signal transduction histidine kinase
MQFHILFFAAGLLPFVLYSSVEKLERIIASSTSLILFFIVSWNNYNLNWPITLLTFSWNFHITYALTYSIIISCTALLIQSHEVNLAYLDEERTRLINTDKLATLGELSSSLAHELKNPLAVIISRGSLIVERLEIATPSREELDKGLSVILRTANRIEQTIKSIQALSRDSTRDNLTPIHLKVLLDDVSILLDHKIKAKDVDLRIVKYDPLWQVMGRESQLVQVLMNLISNAIDAIESMEEKWVEVEFLHNAHHFIIQIKDCGKGIPTEVAERIMSPFFTTKTTGKGTGLGLSISKRIMKDHHGDLVYIPNSGNTVFQMQFPSQSLYTPIREKQAT